MSILNIEVDSRSDDSDDEYKPNGESDVYSEENSNSSYEGADIEKMTVKKSRGRRESGRCRSPAKAEFTEGDDKERSDALWANFLSDGNSDKHGVSETSSAAHKQISHRVGNTTGFDPSKPSVSKPATKPSKPLKRPVGGIYSILEQLNKKSKLTVLESSKEDWESFKTSNGLNEDLRSFNRGKNGYLEKQDFLERTDVRQFEIEKVMRQERGNK